MAVSRFSTSTVAKGLPKYQKAWDQVSQPSWNYYSIATQTVGSGGASTITFSNIPQTYTHLQLRVMQLNSASGQYNKLQFNSDTSNSYWLHSLQGNGSSASATAYGALASYLYFPSDTSNTYPTVQICDILDYTSINKNKTIRSLEGYDANGSGGIRLSSGLWSATPAAISSITITSVSNTIQQYSQFALYGVK